MISGVTEGPVSDLQRFGRIEADIERVKRELLEIKTEMKGRRDLPTSDWDEISRLQREESLIRAKRSLKEAKNGSIYESPGKLFVVTFLVAITVFPLTVLAMFYFVKFMKHLQ